MPGVSRPVSSKAQAAGYPRLGGGRLSDRVAGELQRRILGGQPEAGERLPTEARLCELFGVSRSVIRDALRTLGARGLVRVGAGQGIFVTDPSDQAFGHALVLLLARSGLTMRDVTEARAAIEIHLSPLALERGTPPDWDYMESHLLAFAEAVEGSDWSRAHSEHLAFHLAILHAIHSPALEILLAPMHEIVLLSSIPPADTPELWDVPAHRPVLEAFRAGDTARTHVALDDHFHRFLNDERYASFEATPFREAGNEALRRLDQGHRWSGQEPESGESSL